MKLPNLIPLVVFIIIAGIIWFIARNKDEKKTINVRSHKRTITVKGHSRNKPKAKKKNRRSGRR
ncbi:MAG: hypothetical protein C6Y22_14120 [Hapalosiphonaceae cyanobacterium JJU2]|nr:MAG: hypothetical protein C6Y22_14120 [Hapalosiphonaceae cyanobacterium JJU2]